LLGGCGPVAGRADEPAAHFHSNGVSVTIKLSIAPDGGPQLVATFRPDEPGFHLYSIDLPVGGVDGLGVPTSVAVRGDLRAQGQPTTDAPIRTLRPAGLDAALPVYPDGPVTVTLNVNRTGRGRADAVVGYAACSEDQCLPPVIDQPIRLDLN
jgi:hypothetical protein